LKQKQYTRDEEARLAREMSEGRGPRCPRCGATLRVQDVGEAEGVSYVRDRVWLTCEGCRRSIVLDRRRTQRRP
jgi:hypothetical protein